ncbi:MAG: acyl-CoA dehydrogenase family protein [Alcanivorax sp.]|nr:acyl-CoA dehydrogenase family protein [Alcanivorax sp.]
MDFLLNDEQQMLADSARRFIQDLHASSTTACFNGEASLWRQFAELGWLALPFSEDDGGLGGGLADTMVLLEELGRGRLAQPYVPTVVLGGGLLRRAAPALREQYLPALMAGELQLAVALDEHERAFDPRNTTLAARVEGDQLVLTGGKVCVVNGDRADLLLVVARSAGQPGDTEGLHVVVVDASAPGITRQPHRLVDGQQGAQVYFDQVRVAASAQVGAPGAAWPLLDTVLMEGLLAVGALALGGLTVLLDDTVEYSKTRRQFGVPIGSFQVLQHRMANMYMALEQTRSLLLAATLKTAAGDADARHAVHALKAQLGRGGRLIAQEAIQLHGGMGMTDELPIGHYFKQITAIDQWLGGADFHLQALGAIA